MKAKQSKRSRGQSLVEMALLMPVLVLLLAGVVDFGRAMDAYITITNGVREGARYGSLHPTDTGTIALRTINECNGSSSAITGVTLDTTHVAVTFPGGGAFAGNPVRVTADYELPLFFGGILGLNHIRILKSADMAIMYSPITPPLEQ